MARTDSMPVVDEVKMVRCGPPVAFSAMMLLGPVRVPRATSAPSNPVHWLANNKVAVIIATILQHYTPQLVPGSRVVLQPRVTLRPRYGMRMLLQPATSSLASVH